MVNQPMSTSKRVLDCSPLKSALKKGSTSEAPEDRPRKRVLFSDQALTEPPKGRHGGTEVLVSREKSSSLQFLQGSPRNSSRGVESQTAFNRDSTQSGEGNKETVSPTYPFHKNGPAIDRLWSGIIEVPDCGLMTEEMTAHLSFKVSRKAFEFSKKINSKLQFKLLRRTGCYPDIFLDSSPDRNDIALYFYPDKTKAISSACSSRKQYSGPSLEGGQPSGAWQYSELLKCMIDEDLMMRSRIDGIDLLVFPSTILSADSQTLMDSYFMWGVFRRGKDETWGNGDSKLRQLLKDRCKKIQ